VYSSGVCNGAQGCSVAKSPSYSIVYEGYFIKLKFIFIFFIAYLTPQIRDNLYIVIKLTFILSILIVYLTPQIRDILSLSKHYFLIPYSFFNTYDQG
jgi:hypothetical protein